MWKRTLGYLALVACCGCADERRDSPVDPLADPALTEQAELYLRFDLPRDGAVDLATPEQRAAALAGTVIRIGGHTHDGRPVERPFAGRIGADGFDLDAEMFVVAHMPGGEYFIDVEFAESAFDRLDRRLVTLAPGDRRSIVFEVRRRSIDFTGYVRRSDNGPLPRDLRIDLGGVADEDGSCMPTPVLLHSIEADRRGRWLSRVPMPLGDEVCVRAAAAGFAPASVVVSLPDNRAPAVAVPDLEIGRQELDVAVFTASPLDDVPFSGPEGGLRAEPANRCRVARRRSPSTMAEAGRCPISARHAGRCDRGRHCG